MRKFLILFIFVLMLFSIAGCGNKEVQNNREEVTVNLPRDNSVNGYRVGKSENKDDTVISADDVTVVDKYVPKKETEASYCANKNSKVYHKIDCDSVGKMKEENKVLINSKADAVSKGYSPCKVCNP